MYRNKICGLFSGMLVSGFTIFTPKFIESQFSIPAGWAAQLVGKDSFLNPLETGYFFY